MAKPEPDHAAGARPEGPDPGDPELPGDPPEPRRTIEIPVGIQVLALPEEIAAELSRLGEAGLRSLVGTRVWLEPLKGRLFLHFGDVDHGAIDP
jgi:hypothetical protein